MKTTIETSEHAGAIELTGAKVFDAGEYAGNVEFDALIEGNLDSRDLNHHLRVRIPGELALLEPTAHKEIAGGYRVTCFSAEISNSGNLPTDVEAFWEDESGRKPLGKLPYAKAPASDLKEKSEDAHLPS